jgi:hypothetical protein
MEILLVLALAATATVAAKEVAVLPAGIVPSTVLPAEHAYVVSVYVGAPPEELKLEVRFDAPGIWIYRDQSIHSASHVTTNGGSESDIVYFGGVRQRCETRRGVPKTLTSSRLCGACDGVLGLRGDSDVWQWWADASFTPASVTLGGKSPPVELPVDDMHTWELPCEGADSDEGALCVVDAVWRGSLYRAVIMPHASHVLAPRHVVDGYLEGKNLYDDAGEWDDFVLEFTGDEKEGGVALSVALGRDELSGQHGAEARELLIDVGPDNNTIVLGSVLLRRFAMYRTADRGKIILHAHPVFTNLPHANSILFFFAFCFYVRWKSTDLGRHYARAPKRVIVTVVDLLYQIAGWAIAVAALLLPSTWAVLLDVPALHAAAATIIVAGILIEAAVRMLLVRVQVIAKRQKRPLSQPRPNTFLLVLIESAWHEAVLTTAMWMLVAPRRREDLAGPLTAVAGAVAVYSFTVHLVILTVFTIVRMKAPVQGVKGNKRRRTPSRVLLTIAYVSVVGLAVFFGALFVWVFALPALVNLAGIYSELVYAVAAAIVAFIVLGAVAMADSYIEQSVRISAKQHLDALTEKEQRRTKETPAQISRRWDPFFQS